MEKDFVIKNGRLEKYIGKETILRIPDGVRSIGRSAFSDENYLKAGLREVEEIIFPEGITEISWGMFWGCGKLKRITLPEGLRIIDQDAFSGCSGLVELIVPNSVSIIGSGAFYGCFGIKKIRISDAPQKIVRSAFYDINDNLKPDWFVRDWEIEIVSLFPDEISQKQLISALRYDNLAYTFLRGKLRASDDYIKLVTKWLRTKANRKVIVDAAIERNDHHVIDALFRHDLKFTKSEIDEYVKSSNIANRVELTAVILAGYNNCKTIKKDRKKKSDEDKSSKLQLSVQEKVELLESAVLKNDIDNVKSIFDEHSPIIFTARAIGLAARYAGSEMVETLIESGATLDYLYTSTMIRMFDCSIPLNTYSDLSEDYGLKFDYIMYLFHDYDVKGYPSQIIPDEERKKVLRVLYNKNEGDLKELLYYAIMYNDIALLEELKTLNVCKLSDYRTDIISGKIPITFLDAVGRYYKYEFYHYLNNQSKEEVIILNNLLSCMDVEKIVFRTTYYYNYKQQFIKRFCSKTHFDFYIHNTDMGERVKKWEMLCALIDENNVSGMQYALNEKWIKKHKDLKDILDYARNNNANSELIQCIADALNNKASDNKISNKAKEDGARPLSAAELKKIWGTKNQEDGTIMITSYKGSDISVVVPSMIGKKKVTAIDPETFSSKANRITEVQKNNRRNIISVEFPGSIKEIPKHIFYDGFSEKGRNILKKIILNEGTVKICDNAFEDCSGIEDIIIPDSVIEIGKDAFSKCRKLKRIQLPNIIDSLPSGIFNSTGFKEFVIPETVNTIGHSVFSGCKNLNSVSIPNTVNNIADCMFAWCSSLSSVSLPETIEAIGQQAFQGCAFDSFDMPKSVKKISLYAFLSCRNLKEINIPRNTVIEDDAFSGCVSLADDRGMVIINNCLCGLADRKAKSEYEISNEFAMTPLIIDEEIETVAVSATSHPIVYRSHTEKGEKIDVEKLSVGDEVLFGRFPETKDYIVKPLKWRVIAKQGEKALLITSQCIMEQCGLTQNGTWEDSPTRKMLNDGFYNSAFTKIEQEQIVETTIKNPNNKKYNVDGGPDTEDKVFLLSYDEVEQFIHEISNGKMTVTSYAKKINHEYYDRWMLRTPGKKDGRGSASVTLYGDLKLSGDNRKDCCFLRPAIWIK